MVLIKLSPSLRRGFTMTVRHHGTDALAVTVRSTDKESMSLVGQLRGKVYYSNAFVAEAGSTTIYVQVKDFPMGVAQFTLFDNRGIQRAERLSFVNKGKQLKIDIETDNNPDPNALSPIELEVEYHNGARMRSRIDIVYGHPAKPMSRTAWLEKFRSNWRRSVVPLSDSACERVIERIDSLPAVTDTVNIIVIIQIPRTLFPR